MSETKQPDWDKITEGKIRHGFAVAAFTNGLEMTDSLCTQIECWVRYVVDGERPSLDSEKPKPKPKSDSPYQKIVDSLEVDDSIEEDKTDVDYISEIIREKASVLRTEVRDKVIKSLEDGHITKENLDVCLKRISKLANNDEPFE